MSASDILSDLPATRTHREELYQEFHRHPELSMREYNTVASIEKELADVSIPSQHVGEISLIVVLENGDGPVVALRGDIDGLPVREDSGVSYASVGEYDGVPVAHVCGHDVHLCSLLGALTAFHTHRDAWSGTVVGIFQPGEETAAGAQAMLDAGLDIPRPDAYLGQHVLTTLPGGAVGATPGPILTTASSVKVTVYGSDTHGSMPQFGVDPMMLAASIVMRLQTIVAREIAPSDTGVITVGSLQDGIECIVRAECAASRSP